MDYYTEAYLTLVARGFGVVCRKQAADRGLSPCEREREREGERARLNRVVIPGFKNKLHWARVSMSPASDPKPDSLMRSSELRKLRLHRLQRASVKLRCPLLGTASCFRELVSAFRTRNFYF